MARKKPAPSTKKAKLSAAAKPQSADRVFQFKITLQGAKPAIWRRIQVNDCTLDKLHEHIQTAMGWTNSHLHHFKIGEQFYGERGDQVSGTDPVAKTVPDTCFPRGSSVAPDAWAL